MQRGFRVDRQLVRESLPSSALRAAFGGCAMYGPAGPVCKGRCQPNRLTEGLCSQGLQAWVIHGEHEKIASNPPGKKSKIFASPLYTRGPFMKQKPAESLAGVRKTVNPPYEIFHREDSLCTGAVQNRTCARHRTVYRSAPLCLFDILEFDSTTTALSH